MCTLLLPPGVNPVAVNKYIKSSYEFQKYLHSPNLKSIAPARIGIPDRPARSQFPIPTTRLEKCYMPYSIQCVSLRYLCYVLCRVPKFTDFEKLVNVKPQPLKVCVAENASLNPPPAVSRQNIRRKIKRWMENQPCCSVVPVVHKDRLEN